MRELIYDFAGGIPDGRELKAVIRGRVVRCRPLTHRPDRRGRSDYDSLAALGTFFGAASLIDHRRSLLHGCTLALRSTKILHARVVRQVHAVPPRAPAGWCSFSRRSSAADGELSDVDLLRSVVRNRILGKSLCGARGFRRLSGSRKLHEATGATEFVAHVEPGGGCPFGGESTLEGIVAPSDAHSSHGPGSDPGHVWRGPRERGARHADDRRRRGLGAEGVGARRGCPLLGGIEIPVFCYEPRLGSAVGACRMCLCEVSRRGPPKPHGRMHLDRSQRDWS